MKLSLISTVMKLILIVPHIRAVVGLFVESYLYTLEIQWPTSSAITQINQATGEITKF